MNELELLPLERWLQTASRDKHLFPNSETDYFIRYIHLKNNLKEKVYKDIGSGTSAEDGGIYTDHSITHFNQVIKYAGKLLGIRDDYKFREDHQLKPDCYEVFVLLVSILAHDAGNVEGREEHETKAQKILQKYDSNANPFEIKFIGDIAKAHGGKFSLPDGKTSKDTIGNLKESDDFLSKSFRPQLIAAITRFADEICEDSTRSAFHSLFEGKLPKHSQIYHKYASAITSNQVDLGGKEIRIKYELMKEDLIEEYYKDPDSSQDKTLLIDEIYERLSKIFREMVYCSRFMGDVIKLNRLRATITVHEKKQNTGELVVWRTIPIDCKESGYPDESACPFQISPNLTGEALKREVESG